MVCLGRMIATVCDEALSAGGPGFLDRHLSWYSPSREQRCGARLAHREDAGQGHAVGNQARKACPAACWSRRMAKRTSNTQVAATAYRRPSQTPARYRGHRNEHGDSSPLCPPGHKPQPDTEGIETEGKLVKASRWQSQTPARYRGHRNIMMPIILSWISSCHKPQPDTEGIETEVVVRAEVDFHRHKPQPDTEGIETSRSGRRRTPGGCPGSQTPARYRGHRNHEVAVFRLKANPSQTPARYRGHRNARAYWLGRSRCVTNPSPIPRTWKQPQAVGI
jgi:hypothetical protein